MKRAYLLAVLFFLLLLAGLATAQAWLLAACLPLVVYLLGGLAGAPPEPELQVERRLGAERVRSGERVEVTLTVTNRGRGLGRLFLEDRLPEGLEVVEGNASRLVSLPAGGSLSWHYTLSGRRGCYALKGLQATVSDEFGLIVLKRPLPTDGQLFVLPPVLRLRRIPIKPRRTRVYSGSIPVRQGGAGIDFHDLRDYQPGDPPRWINWRVTARHDREVYSNQYEQERAADVAIILDGRRLTNQVGQRSIFEHSILAAAALADAFLDAGNRVGLLAYCQQVIWTLPGYGRIQGERILHDLSQLEVGDTDAFDKLYLPRHIFPSRSQLVLVSPLLPGDFDLLSALRLRGFHLMVISPDPVSFEGAGMQDDRTRRLAGRIARLQRAVLLRRLRGAGIQVVDWDVAQPFEQVAKRELEKGQRLRREGLR